MDFLHALTMNKNVDLAGRMIYNVKSDFPLDTKRRLTEIRLRMFTNGMR